MSASRALSYWGCRRRPSSQVSDCDGQHGERKPLPQLHCAAALILFRRTEQRAPWAKTVNVAVFSINCAALVILGPRPLLCEVDCAIHVDAALVVYSSDAFVHIHLRCLAFLCRSISLKRRLHAHTAVPPSFYSCRVPQFREFLLALRLELSCLS